MAELMEAPAQPRRGDWIATANGGAFWPLDPRAEEVDIEDIAHALSHQCRFSGHTREFMSVAQHCLLVVSVVGKLAPHDFDLQLAALLHDAPEAYLVDVPRPIKQDASMAGYRFAEEAVWRAIAHRFDVAAELIHHPVLKKADDMVLALEARVLMPPASVAKWTNLTEQPPQWLLGMRPQPSKPARDGFLAAYRQLQRCRAAQKTGMRVLPVR